MDDHAPEAAISIQLTCPTRPSDEWLSKQNDSIRAYNVLSQPLACTTCTCLDARVARLKPATLNGAMPPDMVTTLGRPDLVTRLAYLEDIDYAADVGGCSTCSLLRKCIHALADDRIRGYSAAVVMSYCAGSSVFLKVSSAPQEDRDVRLHLFCKPGVVSPWPAIGDQLFEQYALPDFTWTTVYGGIASFVAPSGSSPSVLARIKEWIAECERDHPYCSPRRQSLQALQSSRKLQSRYDPPPKRLILLGESNSHLQLIQTRSSQEYKYVALSYCWGRSKKLVCTTDNYNQLLESVPFDALPRIVQDTTSVARELGIQYLWADRLCIKQDDRADWETEAAAMGAIYSNAYLTIAATGTNDCDDSLFTRRQLRELRVDVTDMSGNKSSLFAREVLPHDAFDWPDPTLSQNEPLETRELYSGSRKQPPYPLMERGWCLQERLLSPRIIHFTPEEAIFECLGMISCECGSLHRHSWSSDLEVRRQVVGIPPDVELLCGRLERARTVIDMYGLQPDDDLFEVPGVPEGLLRDVTVMSTLGLMAGTFSSPDFRGRWMDLVIKYSNQKLTYVSDRLPALSGLAERLASTCGEDLGTYLAGLWSKDLLRSLLWMRSEVGHRDPDTKAPTWSWVSADGPIDYVPQHENRKYHVTITDTACRPAGIDGFGAVRHGGRITLRGLLAKATTVSVGSHTLSCQVKVENRREGKTYTSPTLEGTWDRRAERQDRRLHKHKVYLLWWCSNFTREARDESTPASAKHPEGFENPRFLVLVRQQGIASHVYRRVSVVISDDHEVTSKFTEWNVWKESVVTII